MKKFYHILLFISSVALTSCFVAAGSYTYAESYIIDSPSRDSLVHRIKVFKQIRGMDLFERVPEMDTLANIDGLSSSFYMMHFKIHDSHNDTIAYRCAINMSESVSDSSEVKLSLVSVSEGIRSLRWKEINTDDLVKEKNQYYKSVFEKEVLGELGYSWKRDTFMRALMKMLKNLTNM